MEEGIAEAVASRLFQENVGFSRYGSPSTIAAGTWLRNGQLIPRQELKDGHFDISQKCLPQSYTLRADFFKYLLEAYGKQDFMDFIYAHDTGSDESYHGNFEKSLSTLETDWLLNLQLRLENFDGADSQITAYKEKIDELLFYVCEAGVDF